MGVVYDPMADELFWSIRGRGAFVRRGMAAAATTTTTIVPDERIHVSGTTDLTQSVVAMDAGYGRDATVVDRYLAVQRAILLQRVRHVRVFGCCGYV